MEVSYEESAHVIIEAEKSHHLPSARGRPRRADSVVQSEPKGLRNGRRGDGVCPSLRAGGEGRRHPGQSREAGKQEQTSPSPTSCLTQALSGLDDAHPRRGGPSILGIPPIQMFISPETQTHPEKCLTWASVASHVDTYSEPSQAACESVSPREVGDVAKNAQLLSGPGRVRPGLLPVHLPGQREFGRHVAYTV